MRILMVAHAYPPTIGGVESHLSDICAVLSRRGHAVTCLVGGQGPVGLDDVVRIVRRPELMPRSLIATDSRDSGKVEAIVQAAASQAQPDVIHGHNAHHYGVTLGRALVLLPGPVFNTVHDPVFAGASLEALRLDWTLTIYVSKFMRSRLPTSRPSTVLPLGIDVRAFAEARTTHSRMEDLERPVVFHPARLLAWKGVLTGLEAFATLRARVGTGTLVLCGSEDIVSTDEENESFAAVVARRASELGILPHLRFYSFTHAEMPSAYRGCDLVWYPSIGDEPLGLVPLEAMAAGVPVIVSASGGLIETVTDGVSGHVVPRDDAPALANAAFRIWTDPSMRANLVEAARAAVGERDLSDYVSRLERLYETHQSKGHVAHA